MAGIVERSRPGFSNFNSSRSAQQRSTQSQIQPCARHSQLSKEGAVVGLVVCKRLHAAAHELADYVSAAAAGELPGLEAAPAELWVGVYMFGG